MNLKSEMAARLEQSERIIYSVSRLNRETRFLLNESFGTLWVEGEISNLATPGSGHLYFSLKDSEAQVRCAMFRPRARLLGFAPKAGDLVIARAEVSLYEPRGEFQLIVESLERAGEGVLLRAFEALKSRLAREGLFDVARKRSLPTLPRCVGVVTSPTGAAVRDILSVLRRRFAAVPVIIFPVQVQGNAAAAEIVAALARADRLQCCDVLILARGGGSLEDLWTFNEESVARAIAACSIPIVTGIGHEIDVTIADFVADLRAPTPSAAAEAAVPDAAEWLERLGTLERRLARGMGQGLHRSRTRLDFVAARLWQTHPWRRLTTQNQRLDELDARLRRAVRRGLAECEGRLQLQRARLARQRPDLRLERLQAHCQEFHRRLIGAFGRELAQLQRRLATLGQTLQTASPLATLARGYSLTRAADSGALIRSWRDVVVGTRITTLLAEGELTSVVEQSRALTASPAANPPGDGP